MIKVVLISVLTQQLKKTRRFALGPSFVQNVEENLKLTAKKVCEPGPTQGGRKDIRFSSIEEEVKGGFKPRTRNEEQGYTFFTWAWETRTIFLFLSFSQINNIGVIEIFWDKEKGDEKEFQKRSQRKGRHRWFFLMIISTESLYNDEFKGKLLSSNGNLLRNKSQSI